MTERAERPSDDAELVTKILLTLGQAKGVPADDPRAEALTAEREEAYRVLIERHWRVVVLTLRAKLPNPKDAEDAAQESFIRAWRNLDKLEDPRLFLSWLLRIAKNRAIDRARKTKRERPLDATDLSGADAAWLASRADTSAEERIEIDDEWSRAREVLDDLPEKYRLVVTLRYLEDMSNKDIARALGEPEGTIRNRLFRALAKIRERLDSRRSAES